MRCRVPVSGEREPRLEVRRGPAEDGEVQANGFLEEPHREPLTVAAEVRCAAGRVAEVRESRAGEREGAEA